MAGEDAHQFLSGKTGGAGNGDTGDPGRLAGGAI
jgi:hypothetical protein